MSAAWDGLGVWTYTVYTHRPSMQEYPILKNRGSCFKFLQFLIKIYIQIGLLFHRHFCKLRQIDGLVDSLIIPDEFCSKNFAELNYPNSCTVISSSYMGGVDIQV